MFYLHCSENQDFRKTENKKRETKKKKGKMKGIDPILKRLYIQ